jgi:hypothetical protein
MYVQVLKVGSKLLGIVMSAKPVVMFQKKIVTYSKDHRNILSE